MRRECLCERDEEKELTGATHHRHASGGSNPRFAILCLEKIEASQHSRPTSGSAAGVFRAVEEGFVVSALIGLEHF